MKEKIKEAVISNLETHFVEKKEMIQREIDIINIFISSFTDIPSAQYTYDEYCLIRMKSEIEACELLDMDAIIETGKLSDSDKKEVNNLIQQKIQKNPDSDQEEIVNDVVFNFNVDTLTRQQKEIHKQLVAHSMKVILKNKIPSEVWNSKEDYFENFCKDRAEGISESVVKNNRTKYEESIRIKML